MTLWAIVPVKPLRRGKSRLSGVLTEDERAALNQVLLVHTLDVIRTVPGIEQVLVVSRDPAALAMARDHGARTVLEHGAPELNSALERATLFAMNQAILSVLILPADLPLLRAEDIEAVLEKGTNPPVVVITPDRHYQGTNALLVSPAGMFRYVYGPGSFDRHCQLVRKAGARLEICECPSIALDLDVPEDLELVNRELEGLGVW